MIFQGFKIKICEEGFAPIHLKILKNSFLKNGGQVVEPFEDADCILCHSKKEAKALSSVASADKSINICWVDAEWISNSLIESRKLPTPNTIAISLAPQSILKPDSPSTPVKRKDTSQFESPSKKLSSQCSKSFPLPETASAPLNSQILHELELLAKIHATEGDRGKFRVVAYRKAISAIKLYDKEIKSGKDVANLNGVGAKTVAKIDEILATGKLRKTEHVPEKVFVLDQFIKVHGAGAKIAEKWYDEGCRTLDDLRARPDLLQKNHKTGLQYFDDLQIRIPRQEIEEIGEIVMAACKLKGATATIMGSYRRGAKDSGDADFLVYPNEDSPHNELPPDFLDSLIDKLTSSGLIVACLSKSDSVWQGICHVSSGIKRRIDFLLCPRDELGSALLHFTGNELFNRSIRTKAMEKGYHLSQRGLFLSKSDGTKGKRVASEREEDIFQILGVAYHGPTERNM